MLFSPFSAADIDGAYFGTSFAHLLLLSHPASRPPPLAQAYIPRIFGFRVFSSAAAAGDAKAGGAEREYPRPNITTCLDRAGGDGKELVAPDGRRLVIENEDFLDLDELVAQQLGVKRGKKNSR